MLVLEKCDIGNVFVCEKTGYVYVCDDACRAVGKDPTNELLVLNCCCHRLKRNKIL
ncbi:hypothetical protein Dsin_007505, partial [Dipteronia sinensis]